MAGAAGGGELGGGLASGIGLEVLEGLDDGGEDGALAVAGRQGDDGEEVEGLVPVSPGFDDGSAGAGGGQDGEAEEAGEIGGGLGGAGLGADEVAELGWQGAVGKFGELRPAEGDDVWPGWCRGRLGMLEGVEEAIEVGFAGFGEEEGGAADLGGGLLGGLDEALPGGIEAGNEFGAWGFAEEGLDEEVRGGRWIVRHGAGLSLR